jgi:hypothetical protein
MWMSQADIEVPNCALNLYSLAQLACYPQRSFFNNTRPFLKASCGLYALLTQLIDVYVKQ